MKYIDADQIRAEIERLKNHSHIMGDIAINSSMRRFYEGAEDSCNRILAILDTLPEQPANDGLEEAAQKYYFSPACSWEDHEERFINAFKAGAEWQKDKMLEGAVEGKVAERVRGKLYARCQIPNTMGIEFGDKVRVIVIKED